MTHSLTGPPFLESSRRAGFYIPVFGLPWSVCAQMNFDCCSRGEKPRTSWCDVIARSSVIVLLQNRMRSFSRFLGFLHDGSVKIETFHKKKQTAFIKITKTSHCEFLTQTRDFSLSLGTFRFSTRWWRTCVSGSLLNKLPTFGRFL